MSQPSLTRLAALCAIAAATALGACAGAGDDTSAAVTADSAAGVVDSAPATAATSVAALLSDENVLALLDTAYAVMIEMDRLAQRTSANAEISAFAGRAVSQNALARRGVVSTAERLNVAPVLPDRDELDDLLDGLAELRDKTGDEFDRTFLTEAAEARRELIDEIDDALDDMSSPRGARPEPLRQYLTELRGNLEADRKAVEALRAKAG